MDKAELRNCLESYYSVEELKVKCYEKDIDYEMFPTEKGKGSFVLELMRHCDRTSQVDWLVRLCSERRNPSLPAEATTEKVREHDYVILSESHDAICRLRNVFEDRLPIPEHKDRQLAQIAQLSNRVLNNGPALHRVMGAEWTTELVNVIPKVVILSQSLIGLDYMGEAKGLKSRPESEVKAFFSATHERQLLIERIDRLLQELKARMK